MSMYKFQRCYRMCIAIETTEYKNITFVAFINIKAVVWYFTHKKSSKKFETSISGSPGSKIMSMR